MSSLTRFLHAAIALSCVVVASGESRGAAPRGVTDRLALYDAGRFQEAIQGFATVTDLLGAYEQLVAEGGTWILAASADEQPRRRLVAASFALEVAAVRPALSEHERGLGFNLGTGPIPLVAWGAVALVQRVPAAPSLTRPALTAPRQSGELPWFQAAASLLQRDPTYRALIQQFEDAPLYRPATVFPLIETALARFPSDPELRLARAGAYQRSALSSSIGGRLRSGYVSR